MLRKRKAIVGNIVTWGIGWAAAGSIPGSLLALLFRGYVSPWRMIGATMLVFGIAGSAAGALFSLILNVVYRHRRLEELRPARVGLWAMGGAMVLTLGAFWILTASGAAFTAPVALVMLLMAGGYAWGAAAGATRIAQRSDAKAAKAMLEGREEIDA